MFDSMPLFPLYIFNFVLRYPVRFICVRFVFCHLLLLMFNLLPRLCTFVVLRALAITQAALTYTKISYTPFMTSHKRSVWFCVPIYVFYKKKSFMHYTYDSPNRVRNIS